VEASAAAAGTERHARNERKVMRREERRAERPFRETLFAEESHFIEIGCRKKKKIALYFSVSAFIG